MRDETTISILEALAAGQITAAEAATRLDRNPHQDAASDETDDEHDAAHSPREAPATSSDEKHAATDERTTDHRDRDRGSRPGWPELGDLSEGLAGFADKMEDLAAPFTKAARDRFKGLTDHVRAPQQPFHSDGPDTGTLATVRVRSIGHRVRIIADHSVATVSVTGPHSMRRTGELIEITSDGDIGPSLDRFTIINPPRSLDDLRTVGLGKQLVVRVNPALTVDVEAVAGVLTVAGVPTLGEVRITAGGATITGVTHLDSCLAQAASVTIAGPIQTGRGVASLESGSLTLVLWPDSNVTVTANANFGRVSWPGNEANIDEYVLGNGSARFEISAVMGYITIKTGDPDDANEKEEQL